MITPEIQPQIKGKLVPFNSLDSFLEYFNNMIVSNEQITNGYGTYEELLENKRNRVNNRIEKEDVFFYGLPFPTSVEDALQRDRYQLMDEFNEVYESNIKPRLEEILKESKANLDVPAYKYNDLGLGLFDFNKASTGLIPKYQYYSFEKKEMVDGNEVETIKDGLKYKYVLKTDKSPCVLVPFIKSDNKELLKVVYKEIYDGGNVFEVLKKNNLKIGGSASAFGSTIKKTYLLKENVTKPKNAIRLFIKIGHNADINATAFKWAGYAAIGIAQLLSLMGNYSISIIAICGNKSRINLNQDGNLVEGTRYWGINLKRFDETLDAKSLLYVVSDATFFRVKLFDNIIKQAGYYKDYVDTGLGVTSKVNDVENVIFSEYGSRDKLFINKKLNTKSEFLYYIIGYNDEITGQLMDIYNLEQMNKAILDIGLNIVNRNKEAKELLL